jgi:DNA-binding response OmpR family regulator
VKEGYGTSVCHNGKDAIKLLKETKFDLVLLDVMMPQMDGYMTLTEVRKFSDVPIIMVSAKGEPMDKISGLDYGADDYVTKPFEPQELLSRIKALLRRTQAHTATEKEPENSDIQLDDLYISIKNYIVKVGGKPIDMPPKEIELLHCLASQPMQVFTREQLLQKVWSSDYQGDARTVDVHIKRIREKLGMGKSWRLNTVWGVGYKFEVL